MSHDVDTTIAFAVDGDRLAKPFERLIEASNLHNLIEVERREPMFGNAPVVTEYRAGRLRPDVWSTGERTLWDFMASLAGAECFTLSRLNRFHNTTIAPLLVDALQAALMGDPVTREWSGR